MTAALAANRQTENREPQTANRCGVVDGTRTRNSWNHNPGLYH